MKFNQLLLSWIFLFKTEHHWNIFFFHQKSVNIYIYSKRSKKRWPDRRRRSTRSRGRQPRRKRNKCSVKCPHRWSLTRGRPRRATSTCKVKSQIYGVPITKGDNSCQPQRCKGYLYKKLKDISVCTGVLVIQKLKKCFMFLPFVLHTSTPLLYCDLRCNITETFCSWRSKILCESNVFFLVNLKL